MEKSMDILEKSFKIARLKAKKEVFDDIEKLFALKLNKKDGSIKYYELKKRHLIEEKEKN